MPKWLAATMILILIGLMLIIPSTNASKSNVLFRDQVAVIMYHHVDDVAKSPGTITVQLFQDQLAYLKSKAYQFITLKQFKAFMQGSSVPNNAVLVTFDDGYESFYSNAYPVLKSMRIPAVNFVISGDLENPLASYLPSMSRDEIVEMTSDTNFIDAQCHSNQFHYYLPGGGAPLVGRIVKNGKKESEEEYKDRIVSDTKSCVSKLGELYSESIDSYAYPYGTFDKLSMSYIRSGGIKYAFTVVPEIATRQSDPMQIPRINAGNSAITPEGLNNNILRKAVALTGMQNDVPLADTLRQVGGQAVMTPDGQIHIQFRQSNWTGKPGSQRLTSAEGKTLELQKALYVKNNQIYIAVKDLEKAIHSQIVYNPAIQSFSVRLTPALE